MNESITKWILDGILLCLSLQLLCLSVFSFATKGNRAKVIALICLFLSFSNLYNIFWEDLKNSYWSAIIFSNYKSLMYAPLMYLYFASLNANFSWKKSLLKHLSVPVFCFIGYSVLKTLYVDVYNANYNQIVMVFVLLHFGIYTLYIFLGFKLKPLLKSRIKSKVLQRFFTFYFVILVTFWINTTFSFSTYFINFSKIYDNLYMFILFPISIITHTYVILFAMTESKKFKSYFFENNIFIDQELIIGKDIINSRIQKHLYDKKLYCNPELKINEVANLIGVSSKQLSEFIKNNYDNSFNGYINSLRIDEFKRLIEEVDFKNYSVLGIAQEAGFSSKATFYRVFKVQEGSTPNQYLKSL